MSRGNRRSRLAHIRALAFVATILWPTAAWALPVEILQQTGASANRIDVVILGDGYRAIDQAQLTTDASTLVSYLFGLTPYQNYRGLFNIKLIHVTSNDNGADDGSYGAVRDTALGAHFNCNAIQRLLCVDNGAALTIAAQNVPEYDVALVLVNDPMYGGSGGNVTVASIATAAGETVRHELAHTLTSLADEYTSAYPGYPPCTTPDCPEPNATWFGTRAQVKWHAWIDNAVPVPTPIGAGYNGIGDFEGCRYQTTGVYRPKDAGCLMNTFNNPFCSVCAEGMVLSFWNRVSLIDSATPASAVTITSCAYVTLSVATPTVTPQTLIFAWTIDGVADPATGPTLTILGSALSPGQHSVSAGVIDATALVRNDPLNLRVETASWTLDITDVTCSGGGPCAVDVCGEDGGACSQVPGNAGAVCRVAVNPCDLAESCTGTSVACPADIAKPSNTACDSDGVTCTSDICDGAGRCTHPLAANSCLINGACHASGELDPANDCAGCVPSVSHLQFSALADGTVCDDGNASTGNDACSAGACAGNNRCRGVSCPAADQCHSIGTCDPGTGVCSTAVPKTDGTVCDDADACTRSDSCQAGVCTGANPVICTARDQCHSAGKCDPANGTCSAPTAADGAQCDDGKYCTTRDSCKSGACVGEDACTASGGDVAAVAGGGCGCRVVSATGGRSSAGRSWMALLGLVLAVGACRRMGPRRRSRSRETAK